MHVKCGPPVPLVDVFFFFFNDTATTEIYTLSLHDALPIFLASDARGGGRVPGEPQPAQELSTARVGCRDRKSTRLNSSHDQISYAVFCLKKKTNTRRTDHLLNGSSGWCRSWV